MNFLRFILRKYFRLKNFIQLNILQFLNFYFHKIFIDPFKFQKKIHFSNNFIPNKTINAEIDFLKYYLIKKRKVNILEIGTYLGEFTFKLSDYLSKNNLNYKIITVDPYLEDSFFVNKDYLFKIFKHNLNFGNRIKNIKHLKMKSEDAFNYLIKEKYNFDLIFIDGSHIYEDIKKDLELALYFKKKYGTEIFLDDLEFTFEELLKVYSDIEVVDNLLKRSKSMDYVVDKVAFHPGPLLAINDLNLKVSKQKFGTLRKII